MFGRRSSAEPDGHLGQGPHTPVALHATAYLQAFMSRKYKFHEAEGLYFVTFATVGWVDALSRPEQKDILLESIRYCQREKGLRLSAWVVMSNHVHLVCHATGPQTLP